MLEVADIFRQAGPAYRHAFASRMLPSHLRAMRDIETCRTAALGGHLRRCDHCGEHLYSYHSCRNRHCPKCHTDQTRRWLHAQRSRLLPCSYFLLTFTLPDSLRPLVRSHQKRLYPALLTSSAHSLLKLAADPRYLGARPGLMAVLHTWTRAMIYHPHAHILVTAGGLAPDRSRWIEPVHPTFLLPTYALSPIFRGKFKTALRTAGLLDQVQPSVWDKDWVVHARHAGSGDKVLEYLSRYLFRIAIANSRLERFEDGKVTFRYRDNRTREMKHCTVTAIEFIARFLQHVLPPALTKIRYYGFTSPSRKADLDHVRTLLSCPHPPPQTSSPPPPPAHPPPIPPSQTRTLEPLNPPDVPRCPFCEIGTLRIVAILPRERCPP